MTYLSKVRAGWRRIKHEPGPRTFKNRALKALDYAATATPFRPEGQTLFQLRAKQWAGGFQWEKRPSRFESVQWQKTEHPDVSYCYPDKDNLSPGSTAFVYKGRLYQFSLPEGVSLYSPIPEQLRITHEIKAGHCNIALIFDKVVSKKSDAYVLLAHSEKIKRHKKQPQRRPDKQRHGEIMRIMAIIQCAIFDRKIHAHALKQVIIRLE